MESTTAEDEPLDTKSVKKYYDTKVPRLGEGYRHYRWSKSPIKQQHFDQTNDTLKRALDRRRFRTLVEVGCGPCIWTDMFKGHADRVIALDLSESMLAQCRPDGPRIHLCCADAARLPVQSASADALCSIRAFEYFPDKAAALREFHRILQPSGMLLIVTKNRDYRGYGESRGDAKQTLHSGNITAGALCVMLQDSGFTVGRVSSAIVGRTRHLTLWRMVRLLRRIHDPAWGNDLPLFVSQATESFIVSAEKS